jgi:4-diphosphocytidyl-2C-methyl-D-erythritol 2-phosphate synthase
LADEIKISEIRSKKHKVIFRGKYSKGISKFNTITHLLGLLEKEKIIKKKYQILVKKNIPQKSGMGGGSMNAASILSFFLKKKILTKKQSEKFAKKIGSDVILGLNKFPKIYQSNGKIHLLKTRIKYHLLLVKPNFGCSTRKVFSHNKVFSQSKLGKLKKNISKSAIINSENDLENSAFRLYPNLFKLKNKLLSWKKAEFVRMTGSGSTLVMYFNTKISAKNALKMSKRKKVIVGAFYQKDYIKNLFLIEK